MQTRINEELTGYTLSNRPTPTAIRLLSGSNLHRVNPNEPKHYCYRKVESVPTPKSIEQDPVAKEEWLEIIPGLVQNGMLSRANLKTLANYCLAYAAAVHAQDDVIENGRWVHEEIYNTKTGEQIGTKRKINPNIKLAAEGRCEMLRHAIEFGLTPAASTKVAALTQEGTQTKSIDQLMSEDDDDGTELPTN